MQEPGDAFDLVLLIPAYNPGLPLLRMLGELQAMGFRRYVVVDDGSNAETQALFQQLAAFPRTDLIRHPVNLGKGNSLRTGFSYIFSTFPSVCGVITADADGQHATEDIIKVAQALLQDKKKLILGARTFEKRVVPLRSRIGNVVTRNVIRLVFGRKLKDTQTGLRGIPAQLLSSFICTPGDRYEYEMNMLLTTLRERIPIREVDVETVYERGNPTSHFDPLMDSMRIYFVIIRYAAAALTTAAIDFAAFTVAFAATGSIGGAIAVGRATAISFNFIANKSFVFRHKKGVLSPLIRYLMLVVVTAWISGTLITQLNHHLGMNVLWAKALTESFLFLINFSVQKSLVFSDPLGQNED